METSAGAIGRLADRHWQRPAGLTSVPVAPECVASGVCRCERSVVRQVPIVIERVALGLVQGGEMAQRFEAAFLELGVQLIILDGCVVFAARFR